MQVKRQFFQIYTEYDDLVWHYPEKSLPTLRDAVLQALAKYGFREYIPNKKNSINLKEDVIRLCNPEAEIKYGVTCGGLLYVQVSVSAEDKLKPLNLDVLGIFHAIFSPKEAEKA